MPILNLPDTIEIPFDSLTNEQRSAIHTVMTGKGLINPLTDKILKCKSAVRKELEIFRGFALATPPEGGGDCPTCPLTECPQLIQQQRVELAYQLELLIYWLDVLEGHTDKLSGSKVEFIDTFFQRLSTAGSYTSALKSITGDNKEKFSFIFKSLMGDGDICLDRILNDFWGNCSEGTICGNIASTSGVVGMAEWLCKGTHAQEVITCFLPSLINCIKTLIEKDDLNYCQARKVIERYAASQRLTSDALNDPIIGTIIKKIFATPALTDALRELENAELSEDFLETTQRFFPEFTDDSDDTNCVGSPLVVVGEPGIQGETGTDGCRGPQGPPGPPGTDGSCDFTGGITLDCPPCGDPIGACCITGFCLEVTNNQCAFYNGNYYGDDTDCSIAGNCIPENCGGNQDCTPPQICCGAQCVDACSNSECAGGGCPPCAPFPFPCCDGCGGGPCCEEPNICCNGSCVGGCPGGGCPDCQGSCCPPGTSCCGSDGCCPEGGCCNGECCGDGKICCDNGCKPSGNGEGCCGNGSPCQPGFKCCGDPGSCCPNPNGEECCNGECPCGGDLTCCPDGCTPPHTNCPEADPCQPEPLCCGDQQLCDDGIHCCDEDEFCCAYAADYCCDDGQNCTTCGCCDSDQCCDDLYGICVLECPDGGCDCGTDCCDTYTNLCDDECKEQCNTVGEPFCCGINEVVINGVCTQNCIAVNGGCFTDTWSCYTMPGTGPCYLGCPCSSGETCCGNNPATAMCCDNETMECCSGQCVDKCIKLDPTMECDDVDNVPQLVDGCGAACEPDGGFDEFRPGHACCTPTGGQCCSQEITGVGSPVRRATPCCLESLRYGDSCCPQGFFCCDWENPGTCSSIGESGGCDDCQAGLGGPTPGGDGFELGGDAIIQTMCCLTGIETCGAKGCCDKNDSVCLAGGAGCMQVNCGINEVECECTRRSYESNPIGCEGDEICITSSRMICIDLSETTCQSACEAALGCSGRPNDEGACCFDFGNCRDNLTQEECETGANIGEWMGVDSTCEMLFFCHQVVDEECTDTQECASGLECCFEGTNLTATCQNIGECGGAFAPPTGRCCSSPTNECSITTENQCQGSWKVNTPCPAECGDPCFCLPPSECVDSNECETWQDCIDGVCTDVDGACCQITNIPPYEDPSCTPLTYPVCNSVDGYQWQGKHTECEPGRCSCNYGTCCIQLDNGSVCSECINGQVSGTCRDDCEGNFGDWSPCTLGVCNTTSSQCQPFGACCLSNNGCEEQYKSYCEERLGGTFMGDGTVCTDGVADICETEPQYCCCCDGCKPINTDGTCNSYGESCCEVIEGGCTTGSACGNAPSLCDEPGECLGTNSTPQGESSDIQRAGVFTKDNSRNRQRSQSNLPVSPCGPNKEFCVDENGTGKCCKQGEVCCNGNCVPADARGVCAYSSVTEKYYHCPTGYCQSLAEDGGVVCRNTFGDSSNCPEVYGQRRYLPSRTNSIERTYSAFRTYTQNRDVILQKNFDDGGKLDNYFIVVRSRPVIGRQNELATQTTITGTSASTDKPQQIITAPVNFQIVNYVADDKIKTQARPTGNVGGVFKTRGSTDTQSKISKAELSDDPKIGQAGYERGGARAQTIKGSLTATINNGVLGDAQVMTFVSGSNIRLDTNTEKNFIRINVDDLNLWELVDVDDGVSAANNNDVLQYDSSSGLWKAVAVATGATGTTGVTGPVAGSDKQVLFNYGAGPSGSPRLTFDYSTNSFNVGSGVTANFSGGISAGATCEFNDNFVHNAKLNDYSERVTALGTISGTPYLINIENGNVQTLTVGGNLTAVFLNPPASGAAGSLTLIITNGASSTLTWPSSVKWSSGAAPSLSSSGTDIVSFTTIDAGTTWYGFVGGIGFS